nr:hypothetical protein [Tanacetum cinerariifolium]
MVSRDEGDGLEMTSMDGEWLCKGLAWWCVRRLLEVVRMDTSKVTPIELTTSMIVVNNHETSVSPLPFSIKKKKANSQTVTPTLPKLQGPEASAALSKKRNKPKDKDSERNKPLADTKPSTTHVTALSGTDAKYQIADDYWEKHEEAVVSYTNLRAAIEGYYEDNALNGVSKTLEADYALKEEIKKMVESHNTISGNLSSLTRLLSNARLREILTKMDVFQSTLNTLRGEFREASSCMAKPPSYTKGVPMQIINTIKKHEDAGIETTEEEPARASRAIPISTVIPISKPNPEIRIIKFSSRPPLTDTTIKFLVSKPETEIIESSSGPVIDITPPDQPESPPMAPKADRGKGIATDDT